MKLTELKCGQCGADLPAVKEPTNVLTCNYCRTGFAIDTTLIPTTEPPEVKPDHIKTQMTAWMGDGYYASAITPENPPQLVEAFRGKKDEEPTYIFAGTAAPATVARLTDTDHVLAVY